MPQILSKREQAQIRVGAIVTYRAHGGSQRTVKVESIDDEQGHAVFDGTVTQGRIKGESVWGYFDQVTRVAS